MSHRWTRMRLGLETTTPLCWIAFTALFALFHLAGCGEAVPLSRGTRIGPAIATGSDEARTDGSDVGRIYEVTQIAEAINLNPYSSTFTDVSLLPFTGVPQLFGSTTQDRQWPFYFSFTVAPNNFQFTGANLIFDISRDSSDTEGLFFDGILSGRPPTSMINSANVTYALQQSSSDNSLTAPANKNNYVMRYSMEHFRVGRRNTYNLDLSKVIVSSPSPIPVSITSLLQDGRANFATGDDLAVYSAFLVINGITVRTAPPDTCPVSSSYPFQNVYLHNDSRSTSDAAFSGTVTTPTVSYASAGSSFQSVEFYFDAPLPVPNSKKDFVSLTTAKIQITQPTASSDPTGVPPTMHIKKITTGYPYSALIVNGRAVAESGFDRNLVTSGAVSEWFEGSAISTWTSFASSISSGGTTAVEIDLVALFGADEVRDMLAEGKLNIAVAGSLAFIEGQALTSTRAFGTTVRGPELVLAGTYSTELCEFEYNPDSPLTLTSDSSTATNINDNTGPSIFSVQVTDITSSSATLLWLTSEPALSEAYYALGAGNTPTTSAGTTSSRASFHSITLTGLQPYKVYSYKVKSTDGFGNSTESAVKTFLTLR